jgi:hypothetical protein
VLLHSIRSANVPHSQLEKPQKSAVFSLFAAPVSRY